MGDKSYRMDIDEVNIMVGRFLIDNGIVSESDLSNALELQKYNPDRLVGEILVTQGVITKEDLVMALEMYYIETDSQPQYIDEWLDQDEIDVMIEKIKKEKKKKAN